ncbi:hypothetical protein ACFL1H_04540 [Nanoarchaeota archaeon]
MMSEAYERLDKQLEDLIRPINNESTSKKKETLDWALINVELLKIDILKSRKDLSFEEYYSMQISVEMVGSIYRRLDYMDAIKFAQEEREIL